MGNNYLEDLDDDLDTLDDGEGFTRLRVALREKVWEDNNIVDDEEANGSNDNLLQSVLTNRELLIARATAQSRVHRPKKTNIPLKFLFVYPSTAAEPTHLDFY